MSRDCGHYRPSIRRSHCRPDRARSAADTGLCPALSPRVSLRPCSDFGLQMADRSRYAHNVAAFDDGSGNNARATGGFPFDDSLSPANLYTRVCP